MIRDGRIAELAEPATAEADDAEVIEPRGCTPSRPSSTRTSICARPARRTRRTSRRVPGPPPPAATAGSLAMANTEPPVRLRPTSGAARAGRAEASVPIGFLATRDPRHGGEELTEMAELREAARSASPTTGCRSERAGDAPGASVPAPRGGTIALHEEDPELSGRRASCTRGGLGGARPRRHPVGLRVDDDRPRRRDRRLRGRADPRQHLSAPRVGRGGRAAKAAGSRITCEATPHHLTPHRRGGPEPRPALQDEPAAAAEDDRQALIEALRAGTIDCIATDHAPHSPTRRRSRSSRRRWG